MEPGRSSRPLARIHNACLKLNYFPTDWKAGKLLAIPKQSDTTSQVTNHKSQRPITLLLVLGKMFERIILERFLQRKPDGWFNKAQRGLIRGSNTEAVLFNLCNKTESKLKHVNSGVAAVLLDISSAFYMAWQPAIFLNLHNKGLR